MTDPTATAGIPTLKAPFHYLLYAALGVASVLINPFGINDITDTASQDILYRTVIGPTYPAPPADPNNADPADESAEANDLFNQPATVLLLDDRFLEFYGVTWPIGLSLHAAILTKLREFKPKAVMVDIIFTDKRVSIDGIPQNQEVCAGDPLDNISGVDAFRCEILAYAAETEPKIPLLFARSPTLGRGIRDDLIISKNNGSPADLPILVDVATRSSGGTGRTYPKRSEDGKFETPAFWLYRELDAELPNGPSGQSDDAEMDIIWANRFQGINDRWMDGGCKAIDGLSVLRIAKSFLGYEDLIQTCPYTATIPVSVLLFAADEDVSKLVKDKVVFYGTRLLGTGDSVAVPTHGVIPGVYQHAMAYDNLITYKGAYKKSGTGLLSKQVIHVLGAIIAAMVTVSFARWRQRIKEDGDRDPKAHWEVLKWSLLVGLMFVLSIMISWPLFWVADLSPQNWLGIFGLALTLGLLASGKGVERFASAMGINNQTRIGRVLFEATSANQGTPS